MSTKLQKGLLALLIALAFVGSLAYEYTALGSINAPPRQSLEEGSPRTSHGSA